MIRPHQHTYKDIYGALFLKKSWIYSELCPDAMQ